MNAEDKILEYGREFELYGLTVDSLIKSHRELSQRSRESNEMLNERLERARIQARKEVLDANWIKIDDLRKMTLAEIANLIRED
jgi:ribose 1,5-bisphosphokinase PhnN